MIWEKEEVDDTKLFEHLAVWRWLVADSIYLAWSASSLAASLGCIYTPEGTWRALGDIKLQFGRGDSPKGRGEWPRRAPYGFFRRTGKSQVTLRKEGWDANNLIQIPRNKEEQRRKVRKIAK